ncbi:secoisolariciresinol dehydrogenase-like [Andrographis paniculata]|uniref:secoisolariciresinol dehydrogenase-like n=1 Tax=Andrographis paniculata TaxID=175694 RepID=UPI0021E8BEDF|nr:secoisolariciresinol dehydrogenase-like [Andrographis paniculata]
MASQASLLASALTKRLQGKVALITGGASGIGECTAKLFSKHGAKVVIADVADDLADSVVANIGPSQSTFIHCNVTKEDHVRNAVDGAVSKYGKLDIMFNNAGISDLPNVGIVDIAKTDFERVLSVNVTGVFLGMKHAARVMIPARNGTIISTSSIVSRLAGAATHAYTCSKHGVVGLTRNLAVELGQYGITVNCISPHVVATPLAKGFVGLDDEALEEMMKSKANLKGVVLKADDIANAALFLASDEAKYVSGHNLFVDGGFSNYNSALQMYEDSPYG